MRSNLFRISTFGFRICILQFLDEGRFFGEELVGLYLAGFVLGLFLPPIGGEDGGVNGDRGGRGGFGRDVQFGINLERPGGLASFQAREREQGAMRQAGRLESDERLCGLGDG